MWQTEAHTSVVSFYLARGSSKVEQVDQPKQLSLLQTRPSGTAEMNPRGVQENRAALLPASPALTWPFTPWTPSKYLRSRVPCTAMLDCCCLYSWRLYISSSSVPAPNRRYTCTSRCWPSRKARSWAWRSWAGFQDGSKMTTRFADVRLSPRPPAQRWQQGAKVRKQGEGVHGLYRGIKN